MTDQPAPGAPDGHTRRHHEAAGEQAPPARPVPPRRIRFAVAVIVGILAVAFVIGTVPRIATRRALADEASADSVPTVTTISVRRAPVASDLSLPGTLEPAQQTAIYARASGFVTRWTADIGRKVRAGELLAVIEVPDLDAQLAQAQATLEQAQSGLALAKLERNRWEAMVKDSVVTHEEYDQKAQTAVAANAAVAAAAADVQRLTALQRYEHVTAPFDGIITARNVDVGAFVQATGGTTLSLPSNSASAPSSLFQIARTDTVRVYVSTPEVYATSIAPGQPAAVSVREFPEQLFPGRVVRTARAIDPQSRTLLTEIQVLNPRGFLLPGMYGQIRFVFDRANPPLVVPATALLPLTDGIHVAAVDADSRIRTQKINITRDYGSYVEVNGGVTDGQRLVDNPIPGLVDGTRVHAIAPVIPSDTGHAKSQATPGFPGAPS